MEPRFPKVVTKETLQKIRLILGLACFALTILSLMQIHPAAQLIFMTMWGNHGAIITTALSYYITCTRGGKNEIVRKVT